VLAAKKMDHILRLICMSPQLFGFEPGPEMQLCWKVEAAPHQPDRNSFFCRHRSAMRCQWRQQGGDFRQNELHELKKDLTNILSSCLYSVGAVLPSA
jgi:hypothetical protein